MYQPLTQEQYKSARAAGFSPEKIIQMEQTRKATEGGSQTLTPPSPQPQKSLGQKVVSGIGKVTDFLGGKALTDQLGTRIAAANAPDANQKKLIEQTAPSALATLGSAAQLGSLALPFVGAPLKAASLGLKGLGVAEKFVPKLAQVATDAGAGYINDVGGNLQEGKTGPAALKPGAGTLVGAAAPIVAPLAIGAAKAGIGAGKIVARGAKNLVTAPLKAVSDKLASESAISKLPAAEKALRQSGFDERSTNFIKTATPATKQGFKEMVEHADKGAVDARYRTQPKQVLGKAFLKRIDTIQQDSNKARNEITAQAKKLGKIDIAPAVEAFGKQLESRGIELKGNKLISRGSVPSSEMKYYENAVKEIKAVTKGKSIVTRGQAHQIRQRLFDTLDVEAKKGAQPGVRPFSDKVDQDVNLLRGKIAEAIGPTYQKAAKRFAENNSVLRDAAKFAGVPNQADKIGSKDLKFGEGLLRTLGNASDKPLSLLNDVEKLAKARGGKHKDNILDLADFADSLEDLYGISKSRGFEGGIARGVKQGNQVELPTTKTALLMKAIQAATRTGNEDKIKALRALLGVK